MNTKKQVVGFKLTQEVAEGFVGDDSIGVVKLGCYLKTKDLNFLIW